MSTSITVRQGPHRCTDDLWTIIGQFIYYPTFLPFSVTNTVTIFFFTDLYSFLNHYSTRVPYRWWNFRYTWIRRVFRVWTVRGSMIVRNVVSAVQTYYLFETYGSSDSPSVKLIGRYQGQKRRDCRRYRRLLLEGIVTTFYSQLLFLTVFKFDFLTILSNYSIRYIKILTFGIWGLVLKEDSEEINQFWDGKNRQWIRVHIN